MAGLMMGLKVLVAGIDGQKLHVKDKSGPTGDLGTRTTVAIA